MLEDVVLDALKSSLLGQNDQKILNEHKPGDELLMSKLDLTSLRMVEVCMHLEQRLDIDIDLEDFEGAQSVADIAEFCAGLQAAGG